MQNTGSALTDDLADAEVAGNFHEGAGEVALENEKYSARLKNCLPVKASQPRGIKRVLVCTDFSSGSTQAVECAVALANQCDAALAVLHVVDINAQPVPSEPEGAEPFMKKLWTEASGQMAELADSLKGELDAEIMLKLGLPWEEIVSQSQDTDLVILGKPRGKSGWRFFSKETCERVLANAACPVLVVGNGG